MGLSDHPTVKRYQEHKDSSPQNATQQILDSDMLKKLAVESGADDAGLVSIDDSSLAEQRRDILSIFPKCKSLLSIVCRLNRNNVRCIDRAVSDTEYIQTFQRVNEVARRITATLEKDGINALYSASGFPMDMSKWPGKMWSVSHKTVAQTAGLGVMGLNRIVIHPRFGNFIVLGTVLLDRDVSATDKPLDYNPCIDCKLCAAVCPVGAIGTDGYFSFANCMTHNYRDRMGGFQNWVENIVTSNNIKTYRRKVSDKETFTAGTSGWRSWSGTPIPSTRDRLPVTTAPPLPTQYFSRPGPTTPRRKFISDFNGRTRRQTRFRAHGSGKVMTGGWVRSTRTASP